MATKQIEAQKAQEAGAAQAAQNTNNANAPKVDEVIKNAVSDQAKAAKAAKELEDKRRELEKCLKEIEHKKELTENLSKFHRTDEALSKVAEYVAKEIEDKDFDSATYKIRFVRTDVYGDRQDVAVISNVELINEFIAMLKGKIADKGEEIENELIK